MGAVFAYVIGLGASVVMPVIRLADCFPLPARNGDDLCQRLTAGRGYVHGAILPFDGGWLAR